MQQNCVDYKTVQCVYVVAVLIACAQLHWSWCWYKKYSTVCISVETTKWKYRGVGCLCMIIESVNVVEMIGCVLTKYLCCV